MMHNDTILVVDDNKTNLQLLHAILGDEGHNVIGVTSSREAFAVLENELPDLILLDILMPDSNGIDTCRKLKSMPKVSHIPVIFISSQEEISDKVTAFEAGGVDYITKPFEAQEVLARVKTHLTLYHLQNNLQQKNRELEESRQTIMRQQEQMALQSRFSTMGEILNLIAHHWRQPLSVISTIATNVLVKQSFNTLDDEFVIDTQNRIIGHIQALSQTIDNFNDFFKPDIITETSVDTIFQKAISLCENQGKRHHVQLITETENIAGITLCTYENEVVQVVLSLVVNAIEASATKEVKEPKVLLSAESEENCIIISVRDNAWGIPEEKLDEIFLPYYSTKEKQVGTGLGLYMAKMVIEKHCHGMLSVKNSEEGAEFVLRLPKELIADAEAQTFK